VPLAARPGGPAAFTPETLLGEANAARGARRLDEAARLYRGLQARFPSSREAVLSRLSLGNVLLAQGAFADALEQFRAYTRAPNDAASLGEEALLGEARALAALGRFDDERAVWRALQARFPKSDYAWRARQRLRELDGGAP
jgi:TolA-binding protein